MSFGDEAGDDRLIATIADLAAELADEDRVLVRDAADLLADAGLPAGRLQILMLSDALCDYYRSHL